MQLAAGVCMVSLLVAAGCGPRRGVPRAAGAMACDVPTSSKELLPWLQSGRYRDFPAEKGPHKSRGPHPVLVRTFLNPPLEASLAAGGGDDKPHPACSAAVKELFQADATTLRGWAVSVKVRPDSRDGDGWYWYEVTNPDGSAVVADGDGVELCKDCHSSGRDLVLIGHPLR